MNRQLIVLLVALIAVGCGPGADAPTDDSAQVLDEATSSTAPTDVADVENEEVAAFFARFKSTVRANDAQAVANMAEFPFQLSGITRQQFLDEYYTPTFGEGEFRDRLLAGSPGALRDEGDGRFSFSANVTGDCGTEEFDCESAAVFYFGMNAEGHWRFVDMMFAG